MWGWAILLETAGVTWLTRICEISRLYLNVAIERFNKAAVEEHADGAEVFRRMGHRYISEAELYDATLQQKSAGRLALPQSELWLPSHHSFHFSDAAIRPSQPTEQTNIVDLIVQCLLAAMIWLGRLSTGPSGPSDPASIANE